jgi:hypothetical protein
MSAEGIAYVPGAEEALLDGIQDMVKAYQRPRLR